MTLQRRAQPIELPQCRQAEIASHSLATVLPCCKERTSLPLSSLLLRHASNSPHAYVDMAVAGPQCRRGDLKTIRRYNSTASSLAFGDKTFLV